MNNVPFQENIHEFLLDKWSDAVDSNCSHKEMIAMFTFIKKYAEEEIKNQKELMRIDGKS